MRMISTLAIVLLTASAAQAAAPIEGHWRMPVGGGEVVIAACDQGGALCGTIVASDLLTAHPDLPDLRNQDPSLRTRRVKDMQILNGFTGGPTEWTNGLVYSPSDGGTYHGSIKVVDADTLELTGCVVAPACKTEIWRRIK